MTRATRPDAHRAEPRIHSGTNVREDARRSDAAGAGGSRDGVNAWSANLQSATSLPGRSAPADADQSRDG